MVWQRKRVHFVIWRANIEVQANGFGSHHVLSSHTHTPKHPWFVLCPHTPHDPSLSTFFINIPIALLYPPHYSLLLLFLLALSFFSFSTSSSFNGHQEIYQTHSNSSSQANSQEVFKLRQETWLRWWWPPSWRTKRTLCCLCWWKQKQICSSHLLVDSPRIPMLTSTSRRRIWIWSRYGYHHSLWRSCFSLSNIITQIRIWTKRWWFMVIVLHGEDGSL